MGWRGLIMFYIQDGRFSESLTTHEAILTTATNSSNAGSYGAGVFAFATSGGVSLVFEDPILTDFITKNSFTLIVGIDDITSTNTLNKLRELDNSYPNLEVKVFCHSDAKSLFHPKFIWFKVDEEIRLITGSGNLTEKGLRRNKEAFTVNNFKLNDLLEFESYWDLWISENNENLRELDDDEVIRKAANNSEKFVRMRRLDTELNAKQDGSTVEELHVEEQELNTGDITGDNIHNISVILDMEDYEAWTIEDNSNVLIAEIPNSGNRWKQANFSKEAFEDFFGGVAGVNEQRRILLRHISNSGHLEELEVRPTVSVASRNYRVELNAAGGLNYPTGGNRPIGIFIKVATRSFIYLLVMPHDLIYNEVLTYLNNNQPRAGNRMRRYLTNVEELRDNCRSLYFW